MHEDLFARIKRALIEKTNEDAESLIEKELQHYSSESAQLVSEKDAQALREKTREWLGHGFLEPLLANDLVEEIAVNGLNQPVRAYYKNEGWRKESGSFSSLDEAMDAINKLAQASGKRITHAKPRLNATLSQGQRLHAAITPIAQEGANLSIRKFKKTPWSMSELVNAGALPSTVAALCWALAARNCSIVIAGNAGSGKTSFLNALLELLPENERVVTLEDTPELALSCPHRVALVANEELGVSLQDIVHDSMRMRPDRVVVGEVRSASEARAFFDSLLSGQAKANYCTFHDSNGKGAFARFNALGASEEELQALDCVITLKRESVFDGAWKERRIVSEIFSRREGIFYSKEEGVCCKSVGARELREREKLIAAPRNERERLAQVDA